MRLDQGRLVAPKGLAKRVADANCHALLQRQGKEPLGEVKNLLAGLWGYPMLNYLEEAIRSGGMVYFVDHALLVCLGRVRLHPRSDVDGGNVRVGCSGHIEGLVRLPALTMRMQFNDGQVRGLNARLR